MTEIQISRVGSGRPELWVVAGVHGDEVEGMACAEEALDRLPPRTGTLVCVPVAHPAALVAGTRRGPDGVDLNRTYPGRPDGGATEQVAHALWQEMKHAAPDALLTLHSWSRSGCAYPHVEHAREDGRGRDLAHALGLPFVLPFDWPEGLLPKIAVAQGIPSAELELGGLGAQTADSLTFGLRAIRRAQAWLGMVDAEDGSDEPGNCESVQRVTVAACGDGRVRHRRQLGEYVREGDVVAEIRRNDGRVEADVLSPGTGWIGVHVTYGNVSAGDPVAMLFETSGATP